MSSSSACARPIRSRHVRTRTVDEDYFAFEKRNHRQKRQNEKEQVKGRMILCPGENPFGGKSVNFENQHQDRT